MKKERSRNNTFNKLAKLIKPYTWLILAMLLFVTVTNTLTLAIPRLVGNAIDQFKETQQTETQLYVTIAMIAVGIVISRSIQTFLSSYTSEKLAKGTREKLAQKISTRSFSYVQKVSTAKLLTNFTGDVDAIKNIVSLGFVSVISSLIMLIGSAIILIQIEWQLALASLSVIPILISLFVIIFRRIGKLFRKSQKIIDTLNNVINESIIGAKLIRILNGQQAEDAKFEKVNLESKEVRLKILYLFGSLIPLITLLSSIGIVIIVLMGGFKVINQNLTIGQFTAFYSYLTGMITPIFILGFISNALARSWVSFERINEVLSAKEKNKTENIQKKLKGEIKFENVNLTINDRKILKDISLHIQPKSKNALIGPTAAGKTQLLYLLTGLKQPTSGKITIDNTEIQNFDPENLYNQIGLVFQDNMLFNASILENITFDNKTNEDFFTAIQTAEVESFIDSLPKKEKTTVSERGGNLSGGQKQRLSLSRALYGKPKLLLLDDFTARVDKQTEKNIWKKLEKEYNDATWIVISQKVDSVKKFDNIIMLMDGEIVATGKHNELLENSFEYKQWYESQQTTNQ